MSITTHENVTLKKQSFVVEECCFINCVLIECHLFYSGGDSDLANCRLESCHWHFRGAAQKTIQLQQSIGMLKLPQTSIPFQAAGTKMN
jgi:hypothetical protein